MPAIERERERVELLRVHALQCVFELQVEVINVEEERMWIEKRGGRRRREEVEGEERMWIEKRGGGRRREEVEGEERRWKEKRGGGRRRDEVEGEERRWKEKRGGGRRRGGGCTKAQVVGSSQTLEEDWQGTFI